MASVEDDLNSLTMQLALLRNDVTRLHRAIMGLDPKDPEEIGVMIKVLDSRLGEHIVEEELLLAIESPGDLERMRMEHRAIRDSFGNLSRCAGGKSEMVQASARLLTLVINHRLAVVDGP